MNNILTQPAFIFPLLAWTIFWKGFALWKSAGKKQLIWFILMLVINSMGILEILYVFFLHKWDLDHGRLLKFLSQKFSKKQK